MLLGRPNDRPNRCQALTLRQVWAYFDAFIYLTFCGFGWIKYVINTQRHHHIAHHTQIYHTLHSKENERTIRYYILEKIKKSDSSKSTLNVSHRNYYLRWCIVIMEMINRTNGHIQWNKKHAMKFNWF